MKISVITPSLNQGQFLERTIKSVLEQDYNDFELIVMDGDSKDNSLMVLKKYDYFDNFCYESKPDGGQANAVNEGIKRAAGDVIGWLNSDDVYYPGTLSAIAKIFENHPEINIIYGNADHIDENDDFIESYLTEPWNYWRLMRICYICQPAVFFRKSVISEYGALNESLNFCMDYEFWLRIGRHEKFHFFNRKLAGSRLYATNKTLGSRLKVHAEIVKMFEEKFGSAPIRWLAALLHFERVEGTVKPYSSNWGLRIYFLKSAFYWNRDLLRTEKRICPKEILRDILFIKNVYQNNG